MLKNNKLIQTEYGYYQFEEMPSQEELSSHYANKYYQEGCGNYRVSYSEDELLHKSFLSSLIAQKIIKLNPSSKNIFDIGCGEGYLISEFKKLGLEVKGVDFSSAGIEKLNPSLLDCFIQGDLYEIAKKVFETAKFDVITNTHVIEHLIDPEEFLQTCKMGMHENSILAIKAPNDFSILHNELIEKNLVDKKWWINYPEHLSYFNKDNMVKFLECKGFEVKSILSEFPIDIFLLNKDLNYVNDKTKGSIAYQQVLKQDLFLSKLDTDKVIKLYEAYADLGLGRSLTYFCKLKG